METFVLYDLLRLVENSNSGFPQASTFAMDVDNTTMFHVVQKGRVQNELIHNLVSKLIWLQVDEDFTLK